jgi:hypothetical protein
MFFGSKKKKQQKKLSSSSSGDVCDSSSDAVMDKVVAGTINMSKNKRANGKNDSAVDIIVDSDEDEIFDDDDEDEQIAGADDSGNAPSSSLDYRDMLAAGASVVNKAMSGGSKDKEDGRRDSYDRSEDSDHEDREDETDSEEEDDKGKSGNGSDSGEDYTDDEDEGEDGYRPGGYHPVKVGEVYNQRYVLVFSGFKGSSIG